MRLMAERGRDGAAGGIGETGDSQGDRAVAAGGDLIHLGELGAGTDEADLQALGLAEPAVGFGFGDTGEEVVPDLLEARSGGGVGAQKRAAQTAVFMDAGSVVRAAAVADGDLALFEVADELRPFLIGRGAVFLAGAQPSTSRLNSSAHCSGHLPKARNVPSRP